MPIPLVPGPLPESLGPWVWTCSAAWPVKRTWEQVIGRAQSWAVELEAEASAVQHQAKCIF